MTTVVGIYRARNAPLVAELLAPVLARGWAAAWWALDEPSAELSGVTIGSGSGEKLPLLQTTIERSGRTSGSLVLSDDDIAFRDGDLPTLVELSRRAGLGLAQPAHVSGSHVGHGITRQRSRSRVRLTTFVESGPLVVIDDAWVDRVVPLPVERRMGWGIELEWADLRQDGCRLGIVDAVSIEHLGKVATEYDDGPERARIQADFAARGITSWSDVQQEIAVWRPWQRRPPWLRSEP
ncbi:MAG: hypothetical protein ACRC50_08625 [Gaiella sp.]